MHRLPPLPSLPAPPPRTPFPVIAVVAPAVGAVVVSLVTGSLFVLVFAALSPIIAIATALDARRAARRHRRDEAARFDRDCASWLARVPELHAAERTRADAEHPPARVLAAAAAPPDPASPVRIGTAAAPSGTLPEAAEPPGDGPEHARLRELVTSARLHPALPVLIDPGRVAVLGRGVVAESVARALELHPGCAVLRSRAAIAPDETPIAEIVIESATRARLRTPDGVERSIRPEGLSRRERDRAHARRARPGARLPESVPWSALAAAAAAEGRPIAPGAIGVAASGEAALDLLGESPHALIGGTTGSGKSELLRTLALSWAVGATPQARSILLVDFKGGSAFAELAGLPHVVGLITDLDARAAARALRSLRAELRRRESLLLEHRARDIRELAEGVLARLLVLVDEYAALVEAFPELQPLFADLAARGRSLGIHLVLCTQRPAGVVRDAVAANCGIRVAFRLTSPSDAAGLLAEAPPSPDAPPGRAVVSVAGRVDTVQVATIDERDAMAVAARWAAAPRANRPWLPPLPSALTTSELTTLPASGLGATPTAEPPATSSPFAPSIDGPDAPLTVPFGMLDDPDRQRRALAAWSPRRDGSLLVAGAHGSGVELALAALAEGALERGARVEVLPATLADALGAIGELRDALDTAASHRAGASSTPVVVIAPALDALVAEAGDAALDLLDALDALIRRVRRDGGGLVASAESVLRARSGIVGRFDSILLLRVTSLDDHRAAGGTPTDFDPDAAPGRGRWQGTEVQVARARGPLPTPRRPLVEPWRPAAGECVAVVSRLPSRTARALAGFGWRTSLDPAALDARDATEPHAQRAASAPAAGATPRPGADIAAPRAVVADAETWQANWAALARVRRDGTIVLADASASEARAVLGPSMRIPLRGDDPEEIIVLAAGETPKRARWSGPASESRPERRRSG